MSCKFLRTIFDHLADSPHSNNVASTLKIPLVEQCKKLALERPVSHVPASLCTPEQNNARNVNGDGDDGDGDFDDDDPKMGEDALEVCKKNICVALKSAVSECELL